MEKKRREITSFLGGDWKIEDNGGGNKKQEKMPKGRKKIKLDRAVKNNC